MIVEQLDRRTMAAMELALERACGRWPYGGKHNIRKRVAQSIIRCARTGNTSLDALTEAAECAAAQLSQSGRRSVQVKRGHSAQLAERRIAHSACLSWA
jgi:hypothetical protein